MIPERLQRTHGSERPRTPESSEEEVEEPATPQLSLSLAMFILVTFTILLGFCSTFAINCIDALTQHTRLTQNFVGLILLPILSLNLDAVFLARDDNLNYSFAITIGGSIQIMALILPLTVFIDWGRGSSAMTIVFDKFQVAVLWVSCILLRTIFTYQKYTW